MNFSQGHAVMAGAVVAYAVFVALGWPFPVAARASRWSRSPCSAPSSSAWPSVPSSSAPRPPGCSPPSPSASSPRTWRSSPSARTRAPSPRRSCRSPSSWARPASIPRSSWCRWWGSCSWALVQLFYHRTAYGKQLKAVAWNPEAAGLMGINIPRAVMASYALSALLAGVAGVLLAPLLNVAPQMGTIIGLKAFAVAIIGGLTSAPGIVIAGLGLRARRGLHRRLRLHARARDRGLRPRDPGPGRAGRGASWASKPSRRV